MAHQQRAEETRAKILEAAETLFCHGGYESTSVDAICRQAGVTKGAFYHHFPGKQALFLELIQYWLSLLDAGFQLARSNAGNVPEAFKRMGRMLDEIFNSTPSRLPLLLEFYNQAIRDPVIWNATVEPYQKYQENFADMIRTGIAEGSIAPIDPELGGRIVVALGAGLVIQGLMNPRQANWGEVAREAIQRMLLGFQSNPQTQTGQRVEQA
ncbi:MAG TPA: TetR/AcrR family transcriptional regulator [Anaerolineaceae bacterium]|jgi:AcrR family transcriptional regulator|nr:TetR/AcrR family transcriptional regulator [Anaerolineaceae bacterium]HQL39926.1 TetR/AcrR family transcriptional regulator [Anaerolineaceae bacterium]